MGSTAEGRGQRKEKPIETWKKNAVETTWFEQWGECKLEQKCTEPQE